MDPNTPEFVLAYWLTVVVICVKGALTLVVLVKFLRGRGSESPTRFFTLGLLVEIAALFVSRLLSFYFDFYLTQFDTSRFLDPLPLLVWRVANTISIVGTGVFIALIDKSVFHFRFKGVLGLVVVGVGVLHAVFPIHTMADFTMVSNIGLVAGIIILLIPLMFFWLGYKTPGLRRVTLVIGVGFLVFGLGGALLSENVLLLLEEWFGSGVRTPAIVTSVSLRVVGLVMLTLGARKMKL